MNRADWILLLLDKDGLQVDGPDAMDPVRIQKGMFLLNERGPAPGLYTFRPYNWGPFSSDVYRDLDTLVEAGLVSATPMPGRSWSVYALTAQGRAVARTVASEAGTDAEQWIAQLRRFLTERSFARLLRDVYAAYPGMATRSHFAH